MQKEWKWGRCLPWYIRQRLCGRLQVRRKEAVAAFAAAAFMLLCFWGVFYPELAFPADVCRRADGSAPDAEDYEKILNAQEGELRVTFSFLKQKPEKRREDMKTPDEEEHREDDEIGSTGIQGESRRGI